MDMEMEIEQLEQLEIMMEKSMDNNDGKLMEK